MSQDWKKHDPRDYTALADYDEDESQTETAQGTSKPTAQPETWIDRAKDYASNAVEAYGMDTFDPMTMAHLAATIAQVEALTRIADALEGQQEDRAIVEQDEDPTDFLELLDLKPKDWIRPSWLPWWVKGAIVIQDENYAVEHFGGSHYLLWAHVEVGVSQIGRVAFNYETEKWSIQIDTFGSALGPTHATQPTAEKAVTLMWSLRPDPPTTD